jgi:hypothetical protein
MIENMAAVIIDISKMFNPIVIGVIIINVFIEMAIIIENISIYSIYK